MHHVSFIHLFYKFLWSNQSVSDVGLNADMKRSEPFPLVNEVKARVILTEWGKCCVLKREEVLFCGGLFGGQM